MKKKLIKYVVFSDIDGTIYNFPKKNLQNNVKQSILQAKKDYDMQLILNTGNGIFKKIKKLAQELKANYIIGANGAVIYDMQQEKFIFYSLIAKSKAKKIQEIVKKHKMFMYYMGLEQFYLYDQGPTCYDKEFLTKFCDYNDWIEDGSIPDDLNKIEILTDSQAKVDKVYKDLIKANLDLKIIKMKFSLEITNNNIDKGSGVDFLCAHLDVNEDYVMTIGDSENDIPMLKKSNYSYAMDNSVTQVKEIAKFYTSDVEQNGLGEAINDYIYRLKFEIEKQEKEIRYEKQKYRDKY